MICVSFSLTIVSKNGSPSSEFTCISTRASKYSDWMSQKFVNCALVSFSHFRQVRATWLSEKKVKHSKQTLCNERQFIIKHMCLCCLNIMPKVQWRKNIQHMVFFMSWMNSQVVIFKFLEQYLIVKVRV